MRRKKDGKPEEVRRGDIPSPPPPEMEALKKALEPTLERAREAAKFLRQVSKPRPKIDTSGLDRALGTEICGPQRPAKKRPRKRKRSPGQSRATSGGRKPEHDYEEMTRRIEAYVNKHGWRTRRRWRARNLLIFAKCSPGSSVPAGRNSTNLCARRFGPVGREQVNPGAQFVPVKYGQVGCR